MKQIDWEQVRLSGMKGFEEAVRQIEAAVMELERQLLETRASLPPAGRMESVWFRKYVALYLALRDLGMPEDLEGAQIGEWLRKRLGRNGVPANGADGRIALATGWKSEVIADLGGGWKIEAIEVPESETACTIYFHKFQEGAGNG